MWYVVLGILENSEFQGLGLSKRGPANVGKMKERIAFKFNVCRLRPYHDEYTRSRLITEVKHRRARIVLGWGTAWEHLVP